MIRVLLVIVPEILLNQIFAKSTVVERRQLLIAVKNSSRLLSNTIRLVADHHFFLLFRIEQVKHLHKQLLLQAIDTKLFSRVLSVAERCFAVFCSQLPDLALSVAVSFAGRRVRQQTEKRLVDRLWHHGETRSRYVLKRSGQIWTIQCQK